MNPSSRRLPAYQSARIVLVQDHKLALIQRVREGRTYYVFPGGKLEPGETPAEAAIREAHEELGVMVEPLREVAQIWHANILQHYFTVKITGGLFGAGDGPEMVGEYPPERGTYAAVWMLLDDLPCSQVVPTTMCNWLLAALKNGWPEQLLQGED